MKSWRQFPRESAGLSPTTFGHLTPHGQSELGLGTVCKATPAEAKDAVFAAGALYKLICIDFAPPTAELTVGWQRICIQSDRKSTRLNSSHLGISYAVFCL